MSPILTDQSFDIITHSREQTFRVGERLGRVLRPSDVVCMQGALGSGKTCLTQGIGSGLAVAATIRSPSFVLISEYEPAHAGPRLYHIDLYRIKDSAEAFALGIEDYIHGDGVTVIEWADHAQELMPVERLWITLSYMDYTKRCLLFEASGEHHIEMLARLRAEVFSRRTQRPKAARTRSLHASSH